MIGAAIGAAGALASTAMQGSHARDSQRRANRYGLHMANNQHQMAVKDLRKAGLNPMLAARYGGNTAPPGAGAPGISPENPGTAAMAARNMRQQNKNLVAQEKQTEASTVATKAQAAKAVQEARLTGANADQAEVMKGFYNALLPLTKDAQKWIKSATEGSNQGGVLQGILNSLQNSASSADRSSRKLTPEQARERRKYQSRPDLDTQSHRLLPIEVNSND